MFGGYGTVKGSKNNSYTQLLIKMSKKYQENKKIKKEPEDPIIKSLFEGFHGIVKKPKEEYKPEKFGIDISALKGKGKPEYLIGEECYKKIEYFKNKD